MTSVVRADEAHQFQVSLLFRFANKTNEGGGAKKAQKELETGHEQSRRMRFEAERE
jgi:hypothetical protein